MIGFLFVLGAMVLGLALCWFVTWRRERNYGPWQEPDLDAPVPEEIEAME